MHSVNKNIQHWQWESFAELADFSCPWRSCRRHIGSSLPECHKHNSSMARQLERSFATVARLERRLDRLTFEKFFKIKDYNC